MAAMLHSLVKVPLAVLAAMFYTYLASSHLRPGLHRLAAFLPVLALLPILPFYLSLFSLRGIAAFFLVWLCEFKLLLLAFGCGPLHSSLPALPFIFTATLPVMLRKHPDTVEAKPAASYFLLSSSIKAALMAAILHLYSYKNQMNRYVVLTLHSIFMYCFLDFFLPCLAAVGKALGMEMEPQFDKPYLAGSLRDFWGRRWNLMVSAILRPSVYNPVRAHFGVPAGILATFVVSGLMHEVVIYYITFQAPTGEVTAFFVLHGVCVAAEAWCARRLGRWRPPRAVATLLVVGFVAGTAFWLFFPALYGGGMDDKYLAEFAVVTSFLEEAGRKLLQSGKSGRSWWAGCESTVNWET